MVAVIRGMFSLVGFFNDATKLGNIYILFQCVGMGLFVSSLIFCILLLILYIAIASEVSSYIHLSVYTMQDEVL